MSDNFVVLGTTLAAALLLVFRRRAARPTSSKNGAVQLRLRVTRGALNGQEFLYGEGDVVTVGRKDTNTIVIPDTGVSGGHFEISYSRSAATWQLVDLGSLNGTTLNRVQISSSSGRSDPYSLHNDDAILVGEHTVFEVACSPSAPAPAEASTLGDLLAHDLTMAVSRTPPPPAVLSTLMTATYPRLRLKGASLQKQASGNREKKTCEDTISFCCPVPEHPDICLVCLCDGHCGDETANHIQRVLPATFARQLEAYQAESKESDSLAEVLHATFLEVDGLVEGNDGCTMSVIALQSGEGATVRIQAANVGDSAVVCADFSQMMKMHLTDSHRVTSAKERERLKDTGSILTHNGTRLMGLNLSRSIGDRVLKDMNPGFLAAPYVSTVVHVEGRDSLLLVIASDGLWDFTNANIVMRIAYRVLQTHPGDLAMLCKVLLEHAVTRRSNDDITIGVVLIDRDGECN